MKRYSILASIAAVGGAVAFQGSYVNLQAITPGTAQTGHSNITGTARAGFFRGNGSQLTNLDAGEVRTGVLTLTGSSSTYIVRASNNDGSPNASALIGLANSPTGVTYGAWAETKSNAGRALFGYASATTGATYGSYAVNNSNGGRAAFGLAQATSGTTYGGWFQSNSPIGVGTYARNINGGIGLRAESSGTALEVIGRSTFTNNAVFSGFVGIGNPNPDWPLHIVSNQNTLIRAEGTGTTGQTTIGHFSTMSDVGNAIYAVSSANSGSAAGVRAVSSSPNGFAIHATNNNPTGFALYGQGNASVTGKLGVGTGSTPPAQKIEVVDDNATVSGSVLVKNGTGGIFYVDSRKGLASVARGSGAFVTALLGLGQGNAANNISYGLYAAALGSGGTNASVYAEGESGANNYAGYFGGLLFANSASSGVKAFMIDHPVDPANKVLMHSSVESDERKNIYDGTITTDSQGFATVTMPSWFEALNEDFRYQLTVIDDENSEDFVLAKVVKRLHLGKFTIRTSKPSTTISWQITGRRHDPVSNFYPLEVEREKTPLERGKLFFPEAYGKPKEQTVGLMPRTASSSSSHKSR